MHRAAAPGALDGGSGPGPIGLVVADPDPGSPGSRGVIGHNRRLGATEPEAVGAAV